MNKTLLLSVLVIAALTSGCASITGSPNQSVSVQTRELNGGVVSSANCELTNNKGKWFVTTPGSVMIHRSNDDMQVLCSKTGFEPGRAAVVSDTKASMFGNIIFGGAIGAIIDHSNGSAYEYPTFIQVLMGGFSKIEVPKTPDQPGEGPTTTLAPASPSTQSVRAGASETVSDISKHRVEFDKPIGGAAAPKLMSTDQISFSPTVKQVQLSPCPGSYNAASWTNCVGEATWPSGEKYVGAFKDGKRSGQGTYTFPSGQKYVGEFNDGNMHGQGTYTFPSGQKYVGEFSNGKGNGQGAEYRADGTILRSGVWTNGVFVSGG